MAKERLSMRKLREVLRLKFDCHLTNRQIGKSCSISHVTVGKYLDLAQKADISWPLDNNLSDSDIEKLLFKNIPRKASKKAVMPSMHYLHNELKRKHVTLQLLWYEYKQQHPDGYQYSYFCDLYKKWTQQLDVCLRQHHRAGEKLFIDYSGQRVPIYDSKSGNVSFEAEIFIATLGASNYTFAEASASQSLSDWIKSHVHAFEFFGGVPQILVPDNLKSAVNTACRYEPDVNRTYLELAQHYGATVIPARVRRPKDKAKVENSVLIVERWILAALRNHKFFSLSELNRAIADKLVEFNQRKFQKLDTSRKELFESVDKPALNPLPAGVYPYALWKKARVNIDYHIEFDRHYYSVPYQLIKEQVDVRFTDTTIEILYKNKRVASHLRSYRQGAFTTSAEHMPKSHRQYLQWTPSRIIQWAGQIGPHTRQMVSDIMESKSHPEQGFRACLGIIRLEKRYNAQRLEKACLRALVIKAYSYRSINSILKNNLDQQPLPSIQPETEPITHSNIRGNHYYS